MDFLSTGSSDLILQSATDPSNQEILTISSDSYILTGQRLSDGTVMTVMATIFRDPQGPRIECETPGLIVNKKPTTSAVLNQGDFIQVGYSTYHVVETGLLPSTQRSDTAATQVDESLDSVESSLQAANESFEYIPREPESDSNQLTGSFTQTHETAVDQSTSENSEVAQFFSQSYGTDTAESAVIEEPQFDADDQAQAFETSDPIDEQQAEPPQSVEPVMQQEAEDSLASEPELAETAGEEPVAAETVASVLDQTMPVADGESPEQSLERLLAALNSVAGSAGNELATPDNPEETIANATQDVADCMPETSETQAEIETVEEFNCENIHPETTNHSEEDFLDEYQVVESSEQFQQPSESPNAFEQAQQTLANGDMTNEVAPETMQVLEQAIGNFATQIEAAHESSGFEDGGLEQQSDPFSEAHIQPSQMLTESLPDTDPGVFADETQGQQEFLADFQQATSVEAFVDHENHTEEFSSQPSVATEDSPGIENAVGEWCDTHNDSDESNDEVNFSSVFGTRCSPTHESAEPGNVQEMNDSIENTLLESEHTDMPVNSAVVESAVLESVPFENESHPSLPGECVSAGTVLADSMPVEETAAEGSIEQVSVEGFLTEHVPEDVNVEAVVSDQVVATEPECDDDAEVAEEDNSVAAILARMNLTLETDGETQDIASGEAQAFETNNESQIIDDSEELTNEPNVSAAAGEESDDVQSYMNSLLQRLNGAEVDAAPAGKNSESGAKPRMATVEFDDSDVREPVQPLRPDEFVPKRVAPEVNSNMAAMRELANAATSNALSTSLHRRSKMTRTWFLTGALSGIFGAVFFGLLSHSIGDMFSIMCGLSGIVGLVTGAAFFYAQMQPSSTAK